MPGTPIARSRRTRGSRRWLAVVAACLAFWVGAPAKAAGVTALAHPSIKADWLDRDFLRAAFTMRIRVWPGGDPITVFVLSDESPVHEAFCREVLGTYPYVLRRTWERMIFTGTGVQPQRVGSLEEMEARVRNTPGAVGYVRTLSQTPHEAAGEQP